MKRTKVLFLSLLLTACASAELISASPEAVSVKTTRGANPGPIATAHCAKYGKSAVLAGVANTQIWTDSIYSFECKRS